MRYVWMSIWLLFSVASIFVAVYGRIGVEFILCWMVAGFAGFQFGRGLYDKKST